MLTGIVLCGGKSIRMGSDKGLLLKDGKTWAGRAYDKLTALDLPTKISINTSQVEAYKLLFDNNELIQDTLTIPGPLVGLLSAHKKLPNTDILLLACDITDVTIDTILQLITVYKEKKKEYDFFTFKNDGNHEPLLGIYSYKGIQNINQLLVDDKLTTYSMKSILDSGRTFSIVLEEDKKLEFRNYNEPL